MIAQVAGPLLLCVTWALLKFLVKSSSRHNLTSVGLCATRSASFGLVPQGTLAVSPSSLPTLPTVWPAGILAPEWTLEDCFPAALLLLLPAAFCRASKRFSICCTGVMWTFFFFRGKQFSFIACQQDLCKHLLQAMSEFNCIQVWRTWSTP